jgi:hypothetical protein
MIRTTGNFAAANAILAKEPVVLITVAGYSRVFTNRATGISGQVDWIEDIQDLGITINDLDGGSDLGELIFTIQDRGGLITADFPSFVFEGKVVTLMTGFVGMAQSDFALLFTGKVDSVASANQNNSYTFTCVDNKQALTKVIYTVADDGKPTDSNHRRTLNGHPLDILLAGLRTEIGLADLEIDIPRIQIYRDGIFAGNQFLFEVDSPPAAKDFFEQQILKPLGGYLWVNNKGQMSVNFFIHDNRTPIYPGSFVGGFADGTGQLVAPPIHIGNAIETVVPAGATQLLLGVNDHFYTDNTGSWNVSVDGAAPITVNGDVRPWNITGGLNSAYLFDTSGSSSPVSVAVTAGNPITVSVVSGLVSQHLGVNPSDGLGDPSDTSAGSRPGDWAVQVANNVVSLMSLNPDNLGDTIPEALQADLVNQTSYRFDKTTDGKFAAQPVRSYSVSTTRYGLFGQQVIESDGMRSGFQGYFLAAFVSRLIFLRYGLKNLKFDQVPVFWTACVLEPGDLVNLTEPHIPDRDLGTIGVTNKLFEVLDRTWDFMNGIVSLTLIDASYLQKFGQYLIAPNGMADFTAASATNKAKYMFLANASDQYSDATPAHLLG